jgi:hypothetical protein
MSSRTARALSLSTLLLVSGCGSGVPPAEVADDAAPLRAAEGRQALGPREELTPAEVVIKLRGNETDLRRCFFANPSARGTLSLSWTVSSDGRVERLERGQSTLSEPRIEQCLAERLRELRFDPREKPARAGWTFVFRLGQPQLDRGGRAKKLTKRDRDRAERSDQGVQLEKGSPGRLELASVENVVEAGFPLFARCYRDGVLRNSKMDGAVRLRFVVGAAGRVTLVEDLGSDLTDRQVVDCVAEGFYALRFPEPEGGEAHLVYRIHFDTG